MIHAIETGKLIETGKYRHYKGKEYLVYGVAQHSESEEIVVVYRALYGERGLWVRPLSMFQEKVEVSGEDIPRFELVQSIPAEQLMEQH